MNDTNNRAIISQKYSLDGKYVLTIFEDKKENNNPRNVGNLSIVFTFAEHLSDKDMFPDFKDRSDKLKQIEKASVIGFYLEYSMDDFGNTLLVASLNLSDDVESNRHFNVDQNQCSIVGAIYVTEKTIKEEECDGWSVDELKERMDIELNVYNSWIKGEVYAFNLQCVDTYDKDYSGNIGGFIGENGMEQILRQTSAQNWLENEIEDKEMSR